MKKTALCSRIVCAHHPLHGDTSARKSPLAECRHFAVEMPLTVSSGGLVTGVRCSSEVTCRLQCEKCRNPLHGLSVDGRVIRNRVYGKDQIRAVIDGLLEGKRQVDIAAESGVGKGTVSRAARMLGWSIRRGEITRGWLELLNRAGITGEDEVMATLIAGGRKKGS